MTEQQIQEAAREAFREIEDADFACDRKQLLVMQNFAFQAGANWALENRWVKFEQNKSYPEFVAHPEEFILLHFDNGEVHKYNDVHPIAVITHFYLIPTPPKP